LRIDLSNNNNNVVNNTASSNHFGIVIYDANNNLVENNTVNSNYGGILVFENPGTGSSTSATTIRGNDVRFNDDTGISIKFEGSRNSIIEENIVDANGHGIYIIGESHSVRDNVVTNNSNNGISIEHSSQNDVANNSLDSNGYGFWIRFASQNYIADNVVTNSRIQGLHFSDSSYYNHLVNNSVHGLDYIHIINEENIVLEDLDLRGPKVSNIGLITVINSSNVKLQNIRAHSNKGTYLASGIFLNKVSNSTVSNIILIKLELLSWNPTTTKSLTVILATMLNTVSEFLPPARTLYTTTILQIKTMLLTITLLITFGTSEKPLEQILLEGFI
jgi:parallel beta-helix repeat protein